MPGEPKLELGWRGATMDHSWAYPGNPIGAQHEQRSPQLLPTPWLPNLQVVVRAVGLGSSTLAPEIPMPMTLPGGVDGPGRAPPGMLGSAKPLTETAYTPRFGQFSGLY